MNLKKIGKVFMSKFVGTGPSSYKKRIYRAVVSQRLRNTGLEEYQRRKNSFLIHHLKNLGGGGVHLIIEHKFEHILCRYFTEN